MESTMQLPKAILERIEQIEKKYETIGQDMESYLDGLLYAKSLSYWDYIHLDTLLSIQNTRTDLHDETIFITYHQINELYFSLILHEINVLCQQQPQDKPTWVRAMSRVNRYFKQLCDSFEIMYKGLDKDEFLQFRMSLLPASGFQSVQYRKIELSSTHLKNLVKTDERDMLKGYGLNEMYAKLYWKYGNLALKSGEKTLTLKQFEEQYDATLFDLAQKRKETNLCAQREKWPNALKEDEDLLEAFKTFDKLANLEWPRQHLKAAVYHLHQEPEVIKATGGTNWQDYLPPKKQNIFYFNLG